jgi:hypothetical protein
VFFFFSYIDFSYHKNEGQTNRIISKLSISFNGKDNPPSVKTLYPSLSRRWPSSLLPAQSYLTSPPSSLLPPLSYLLPPPFFIPKISSVIAPHSYLLWGERDYATREKVNFEHLSRPESSLLLPHSLYPALTSESGRGSAERDSEREK